MYEIRRSCEELQWLLTRMKIMSWNVRGLGLKGKRSKLKLLVKNRKVDILLIQETKQRSMVRDLIWSLWRLMQRDLQVELLAFGILESFAWKLLAVVEISSF